MAVGMVKGMGVDVVEVERIANIINKYGDLFLSKVFTEKEISWCNKKAYPAVHFAGRWASKEAFYKALPSVCQPHSSWKSIEIIPDKDGKPQIMVCSEMLAAMMEREEIIKIHLSISHERSLCTSVVLLE
jgi:holo-[acyl-carrier protein] synthase